MDRRQALLHTASILGGTIVGAEIFLSGCSPKQPSRTVFSLENIRVLDEIGETILPETELSPGAKSAKIGEFINTIVTDCYKEEEQDLLVNGLKELELQATRQYDKAFISLDQSEKFELINKLDKVAAIKRKNEEPHFFSMIKELTIWGYFSSEPGVTQALRYNPIPGSFKGCVEYMEGDKAWY